MRPLVLTSNTNTSNDDFVCHKVLTYMRVGDQTITAMIIKQDFLMIQRECMRNLGVIIRDG